MNSRQPKTGRKKILFFIYSIFLLSIVSLIITISFYIIKFNGKLSDNQAIWSYFGDYVGGVLSPIFSFLTIIILIITLYLQKEELELTRKELHNSTEQQKRSAKALEMQQDLMSRQINIMNQQIFETTFLNLLNNIPSLVNKITYTTYSKKEGKTIDVNGDKALEAFYNSIIEKNDTNFLKNDLYIGPLLLSGEYINFQNFYKFINYLIGFIDDSNISSNKYIPLLITYLTYFQYRTYFLFSFSTKVNHELIEKYSIFKSLKYEVEFSLWGEKINNLSPAAYGLTKEQVNDTCELLSKINK